MVALARAASIQKPRHIWWNVRAHPTYGTVEIRACDVQTSSRRTAAIVALSQALVVAYAERHRHAEPEPELERTYVEDGRFKGMRFGLDCEVVDPETGSVVGMRDLVGDMLETAGEAAARLGTEQLIAVIQEILEAGNGATYQRRLAEMLGGDLRAVQLRLLEEAREQIAEPDLAA